MDIAIYRHCNTLFTLPLTWVQLRINHSVNHLNHAELALARHGEMRLEKPGLLVV